MSNKLVEYRLVETTEGSYYMLFTGATMVFKGGKLLKFDTIEEAKEARDEYTQEIATVNLHVDLATVRSILDAIDDYATDVDQFDYGLPLHHEDFVKKVFCHMVRLGQQQQAETEES